MEDIETCDSTCQSLVATIQAEINALPKLSMNPCIYKVRKLLREVNKEAYTPITVSIGPLHYKDESLVPMEVHKLKYLQSFFSDSRNNSNLNYCLRYVKDNETKIRESYADSTTHICSDKFVRLVLLDSIFIIELFIKCAYRMDDHIIEKHSTLDDVERDIKLAENQLPFFLLQDLYWITFKPQQSIDSWYFTDLACKFFNVNKKKLQINKETNEATCCHLLDLLRCSYRPSDSTNKGEKKKKKKSVICPMAMTLREVGVRFQVSENNSRLDDINVHFDENKGILIMPRYIVMDTTDFLMRNLIAFEQCHYRHQGDGGYMADYQFFLDCLINTREDVQLLSRVGIIENWLGSDSDVSDLVNSLGDHVGINTDQYYYSSVTEQLNRYCDKRWNRYKATLKHTYFKHPWAIISVIYAIILLLLTLIQVVLAIMSLPSLENKI